MRARLLTLLSLLALVASLGIGVAQAGPSENANGGEGQDNKPAHCDETDEVDPSAGGKNDTCPENPPCDADHGKAAGNSPRCEGEEGPPGDETCSDMEDNDGDGLVDQADPDCQEPENPENENCDDGIDNDGDGDTDSADSDCPSNGVAGTCTVDGLGIIDNPDDGDTDGDDTLAYGLLGTENEEGPISSGLHDNESSFGPLSTVVHEGSCVVATIDNNLA